MEERKKGSAGKVIIVILLLIIFLVGGVFAGYYVSTNNIIDRIFKTSEKKTSKSKLLTKELKLDSRLVQFLYDEVTEEVTTADCYAGWRYRINGGDSTTKFNDFKYDKTNEITMRLVGKNLIKDYQKFVPTAEAPVVDGRKNAQPLYGTSGDQLSQTTYKFEKKDVEKVYKQIFGSDAVLDTSVPIEMDIYGGTVLYYDSNKGAYYPQYIDGVGGTCGPSGYTLKLTKAEKFGNSITLTQNLVLEQSKDGTGSLESMEKIEQGNLIYTFELEDDGMYKFISREFKSK